MSAMCLLSRRAADLLESAFAPAPRPAVDPVNPHKHTESPGGLPISLLPRSLGSDSD